MAGMCCTGTECGDWEPVKDFSEMLRDETLQFQERIKQMEANLKSSSDSVRALRKVNVSLTEEMNAMRRVCAALVEESRAAAVRAQFKDDIIREMRRQLKQAKSKTVNSCPLSVATSTPEIMTITPRGSRSPDILTTERRAETNTSEKNKPYCKCTKDHGTPDASATEKVSAFCQHSISTSSAFTQVTCQCAGEKGLPDTTIKNKMAVCCQRSTVTCTAGKKEVLCECERGAPGISIIGRPSSPPILISEGSNEDLKADTKMRLPFICPLPKDSSSSSSGPLSPHVYPGPSRLICQNLNTSPTCSDVNTADTSGVKSSLTYSTALKSCLKVEHIMSTQKSVQIQIPDKTNRGQGFIQEVFHKDVPKCLCTKKECSHKANQTTPDSSLCPNAKKMINRSSSGIFKDSGGACSLADSATGSCDGNAQATYYHNKLLSTLQILRNREETIRVQTESLAVAEERISVLTERANELRQDLERKSKEMQALRQSIECCRTEKVDVSVTAKGHSEVEKQSDIMNTLQSNLGIIEDLYRECFYETAKQEDLIDMLRNSYLDVRLMDKQKAAQIGRLQNVINTQKLSLDRCQEIAYEVDTLKMEISNFLSSSTSTNNDSGMWERSEESLASVPEVQEDLQDITEQLLRLREILSGPCTCGLEKEIKRLKHENEELQRRISEFCQRKCELDKIVQTKNVMEKKLNEEIQTKDEQLRHARKELAAMIDCSREQTITCEQLTTQLRQAKVLIKEKNEELVGIHQQCDIQQKTIEDLQLEVKKTEDLSKENCKLRCEMSSLTAEAEQWREQVAERDRRLRRLEAKLQDSQLSNSEKETHASELKSQLEQAQARGAVLCADVRRVLSATRHWARRVRHSRREQEQTIKEKDGLIAALKERLQSRASNSVSCDCPSISDELICPGSSRQGSCSRIVQDRVPSENEIASCSTAPTPPRRMYRKKKPTCGESRCAPWMCDVGEQQPIRVDVSQDPKIPCCELLTSPSHRASTASPTDELFRRVERLSDALTDAYRRWTRADTR